MDYVVLYANDCSRFCCRWIVFISDIIFRRYETRTIAEMGGIRTQSPRFASMFLLLVLASVALPTTFNFVGEFTVLYSPSQINVWFAF
jgi:NADH-quinone oxidoreductase subunit M